MNKFSKVILVIALFGAMIALAIALCVTVDHFFGLKGLSVMLGICIIVWIAYVIQDIDKMWASTKGKKSDVEDLRQWLADAETKNKVLNSQLSETEKSLTTMEECYNQACDRANKLKAERDDYRQRYEEAQKREALLHKTLREKRGEASYWRTKYEQSNSNTKRR